MRSSTTRLINKEINLRRVKLKKSGGIQNSELFRKLPLITLLNTQANDVPILVELIIAMTTNVVNGT